MPQFRFTTSVSNGHPNRDLVHLELPDADAARREALRGLMDLARDQMIEGSRLFTVDVRDESGAPVYQAELAFEEGSGKTGH